MGILINTGFDVGSSNPIDSRTVKNTTDERDALISDGLVYENLKVYCKDTKKEYRWTGTDWETVGSSGSGGDLDLTDYQKKTDNILTTTDKTIVGAINEVKDSIITNYEVLTNKPSIEGVELDGDKSLSDLGIAIYDDTKVKSDIANLNEYKQNKTDNTLDTTDKTITGSINEVNGNLLDTVGFSADYKNIILNRKSGLNPYTIPISAIINNASLAELKDIDSTDIGNGKILVYDGVTQKHKYVNSSITDELVKMDSATDAKYLSDLIDKQTVINDNGILKVKKLDGQEVTITEINYLKGLTMNVMDLVSAFANGGVKVLNTPLNTASELDTMDRTSFIDGISYIVYVLADENHAGAKTTYLVDKDNTTFFGNADSQRDFTTNPIDLANEVTGKLDNSHIDVDSLWALLTINDTYKTLTTNNEVFGTHGAKAMYDELIADIGTKANKNSVDTHIGDTSIHITQDEKDSYALKTEVLAIDKIQTTTGAETSNAVYSSKLTKDELDKKANDDEVVKKTDISTIINSASTDDEIPTSKAVYDLIDYVKSLITQQPKALLTYTFSTGHPVLPQLNNDNTYDYTWKDTDNSNGTTTRTLYGSIPVTRVNFSKDANRQYLKSLDNTVNMRLTNMSNMFYGCSGLTSVNLTNIDTTNVINMTGVFYSCKGLTSLVVDNFNTINVTTMANMFYGCTGLISFASNFNTANVTDMSGMFANCTALATVNFDIFDTTKVTTMRSMFNSCNNLTTLDLSNFNTDNATEMRYMFYGCNKLTTLRLDNFSSANISNCSEMFEDVPSSCSIYRNSSKFTKTESETGFSGTFKNV